MDTLFKIFHRLQEIEIYHSLLVIEDEYLPVCFPWVTHSSTFDPCVHVALPKRVDPLILLLSESGGSDLILI